MCKVYKGDWKGLAVLGSKAFRVGSTVPLISRQFLGRLNYPVITDPITACDAMWNKMFSAFSLVVGAFSFLVQALQYLN